ncbi:hypothetical protein GCM10008018_19760 [Paenibacillus marchantiophytorum]|uniref:Copper amine oxidase-like N-terminal domain-containing protein n=1 Tax=Paenibacillus marchantiophytorum TaxID=1619310 RepID=A0ABQ2BT27_9BACL|nr:stalk domain-containing protein [Paenibacillus marchantiophytorum]GGI46958.1 hypothetical protein GCM10008018_19760 [Paenibacillus marchantiophytorum]
MKKILIGFICGAVFFGSIQAYASVGTMIEVYYTIKGIFNNNQKIVFPENALPFINNGTTYVPLRTVAEMMGKEVKWDPEHQYVILSKHTEEACIPEEGSDLKKLRNICIADKNVKLPDNTYLDGTLVSLQGKEAYLPALVLKKDKSHLVISPKSGIVIDQFIDPSDPNAFDFLKTYVTGYDLVGR